MAAERTITHLLNSVLIESQQTLKMSGGPDIGRGNDACIGLLRSGPFGIPELIVANIGNSLAHIVNQEMMGGGEKE